MIKEYKKKEEKAQGIMFTDDANCLSEIVKFAKPVELRVNYNNPKDPMLHLEFGNASLRMKERDILIKDTGNLIVYEADTLSKDYVVD